MPSFVSHSISIATSLYELDPTIETDRMAYLLTEVDCLLSQVQRLVQA